MKTAPALLASIILSTLASVAPAQDSIAPPPPPGYSEEGDTLTHREVIPRIPIAVGGAIAGARIVTKVGGVARHAVSKVENLDGIRGYSATVKHIGGWSGAHFVGSAALHQVIPTSLGQMPYVGGAVKKIPVVGSEIAGPPSPLVTGIVAYDSFMQPKYAPCGYNSRGVLSTNDFNSPPRLRQYVNYLAPLPYTHPPIYVPGTLGVQQASVIPQEVSAAASANTSGENRTIMVP